MSPCRRLGQRIGSAGVLDDPSVVLTPVASVPPSQPFGISNEPRDSSRRWWNAMLRLEMEAVRSDATWIDTNAQAVNEPEKPGWPIRARLFLQPGEGRLNAGAPAVLIEGRHRRFLA